MANPTNKGNIKEGASHEDMATHAETVDAGGKGSAINCDHAQCSQRGWIINGCYWCGVDGCVNPGWLMASCWKCAKWFFVNRG